MIYSLALWWKLILALSFLALDGVADDLSLIDDGQGQGNQIISSGWALDEEGSSSTNEPRLQQQASDLPPPPPPPVVNNESLLLSDAGEINCGDDDLQSRPPAPGKLKKRLRFAKRGEQQQQQQQLSCPVQEFRKPGVGVEESIPLPPARGSTSQFNPNRQKRPTTMRKLINEKLLLPITDISVCGFQEGLEIPICALYFVTSPDITVSVLNPCRFCG